jgi:RNA-directed DNA polymerase
MLRKRHPRKSNKWLFKKYWTASGKKHIFALLTKTRKDPKRVYQVIRTCSIGIKRHIKIKAAANPYSPEFARYFWQRRNNKESKLLPALSAREFRAMFA